MQYGTLEEAAGADVLDTRDLEELIDDLETEEPDEGEEWERQEELEALRDLRDEVGSEWRDGVALVRDSYFETYARETAEDIYGTDKLGPLANYIDWERWAEAMQMNYSSVEIDGTTFWYRA